MSFTDLIKAVGLYIEEYYEPPVKMSEVGSVGEERSVSLGAPASSEKSVPADTKSPARHFLRKRRSLSDLMDQLDETFSQKLLRMIDERGLSDAQVYNRAGIDRRHFSKIRNDINYSPNKRTVLAFTIALELSPDEARDLLGCAGYAFSMSSKTDIIILYFLENKIYDMFVINDVLDTYGQPVLF